METGGPPGMRRSQHAAASEASSSRSPSPSPGAGSPSAVASGSNTRPGPSPDEPEEDQKEEEGEDVHEVDVKLPAKLALYARDFDDHLAATKRHVLGLVTGSYWGHEFRTSSIRGEEWTGREKAAFFAALARHSRWRTDLIALDVGKSEASVIAYLHQLEKGRKSMRRRRHPPLDSSHAVEVHPRLIEKEERYASDLIRLTHLPPPKHDWGADLRGKFGALNTAISSFNTRGVYDDSDDDATIARLESMPKSERTEGQKDQLRHLLNRRRNRTAYRRKALKAEGLTEAQIAAGGGVDAIFEREQVEKGRPRRPGAKRKSIAEVAEERESTTVREMRRVGAPEIIRARGLDVFNFETLGRVFGEEPNGAEEVTEANGGDEERISDGAGTEANGSDEERISDENEVQPSLSLPVLSHFYASMLAYLKPLIYQAIMIGEQQARQQKRRAASVAADSVIGSSVVPSSVAEGSVVDDEEGWTVDGDLTGSHVRAALRLRGEIDSPEAQPVSLPGSPSTSTTPLVPAPPTSPGRRPELALPTWSDVDPPPPRTRKRRRRRTRGQHRTSTSVPSTPSPHANSDSDSSSDSSDADTESSPSDQGTDEEDVAIDAALKRYLKSADRAHEKAYAYRIAIAGTSPSQKPSHLPGRSNLPNGDLEGAGEGSKKQAKAASALSRASEHWESYVVVRDSLLTRREKRRGQLRRIRELERKRRKRLKLKARNDVGTTDEEGDVSRDVFGTLHAEPEDEGGEEEEEAEGESEIDELDEEDELDSDHDEEDELRDHDKEDELGDQDEDDGLEPNHGGSGDEEMDEADRWEVMSDGAPDENTIQRETETFAETGALDEDSIQPVSLTADGALDEDSIESETADKAAAPDVETIEVESTYGADGAFDEDDIESDQQDVSMEEE